MTRRLIISFFVLILSFVSHQTVRAQFFYNGRGSASLKWYQIQADKYRILYPDFFQPTAIRLSGFLDTIAPHIGHGMSSRFVRTPIILYTENQYSNGMVTWAPKREEIIVTPPMNSTSTPWLKQVGIHEWRHVVQMSAMKTGLTKIATWILGEAGLGVGLLVISDWQLEGDATNAETQFSEYGRGLQPDFTIEYRAMASKPNFLNLKIDKLICGSYKDHIPDIYKYGYQVMSAAETYIKPGVWGEVFDYSAKWPIFVVPDHIYLRRHYKTSIKKITKRTFAELDSIWQPYENTPESFDIISSRPKSYTTYSDPVVLPNKSILALKTDFDTPTRYVLIDSNNNEQKLKYTGGVSSRPMTYNQKIYWTEYQPHPIYEFKNFSVIREYDLATGKNKRYQNWQSNYLVTPINNGFATVANDSLANGYIRFFDNDFRHVDNYRFAPMTTLHGLAYDSITKLLCFIAVDEQGMWIGSLDSTRTKRVMKAPSAITLSDLRAQNGVLYFGSIQSGKDEIHSLDLRSGIEHRLTSSRFGSTQADVEGHDLYMRTYTDKGWLLAHQTIDTTNLPKVEWNRLPQNILNPKRTKWRVPDADTIPMQDTTTTHKIKRYSKFGRQFNFHSWAPIAVDFDRLFNERELKIGWGATGFFQSTLSDMYGSLSLGSVAGRFWGLGSFTYTGLPVQIAVNAEYGGGDRLVYGSPNNEIEVKRKPFFGIDVRASLPLNFSGGHSLRLLQPSFSVSHYNAQLYNSESKTFDSGYQKWDASLWWSSTRRTAYRNIVPRLGYAIQAGISGTFSDRFDKIYYLWGRGYLPGIMKNHSITLHAALQYQDKAEFNFTSKVLSPRGVINNYAANKYVAASFDYTCPLIYPDWGWNGVIYFKRISMNLFADYSYGNYFTNTITTTKSLINHSWGVELTFDFNLIRSFSQSLTLEFAFPESKSFYFGVGYNFKL